MRDAQARSKTNQAREFVFGHTSQDVPRHVDGALPIQVALHGGVFTFGVEPEGAAAHMPLGQRCLCTQLKALVVVLAIDLSRAAAWHQAVASARIGGGRACDVKPGDLPAVAAFLIFDAHFALRATQCGQGLRCIAVGAGVGCNLGFKALTIAGVNQGVGGELLAQRDPRGAHAARV